MIRERGRESKVGENMEHEIKENMRGNATTSGWGRMREKGRIWRRRR